MLFNPLHTIPARLHVAALGLGTNIFTRRPRKARVRLHGRIDRLGRPELLRVTWDGLVITYCMTPEEWRTAARIFERALGRICSMDALLAA